MTALLSVAILAVSVTSAPLKRDVDPSLIPDFGLAAGVNPDGEFFLRSAPLLLSHLIPWAIGTEKLRWCSQ